MDAMNDIRFAVLGPVMAQRAGGTPIRVTGPTALTLLAGLLLSANRVVPSETLIEWAWPAGGPDDPKAALQSALSRLRKLIGRDRIATTAWGYMLQADEDGLDLLRFRTLSSAAAQAVAAGAAERALTLLDEAIGQWRRPVLANITSEVLISDALPHLTEQYLTAVEQRAALRLRLRRPAGLSGELAELVSEHPFRETLVGHLMVALCQAGRRSEALCAFHELRVALSTELGIAPSPALQSLYGTLIQDPPTFEAWLSAGLGVRPAPPAQALPATLMSVARSDRAGKAESSQDFKFVEGRSGVRQAAWIALVPEGG